LHGFLSVLHHTSLVLSLELSSSLLSSSTVLVSLSLETTTAEDHNCLHELVGTSRSLSKISFHYYQRHQTVYPHITHAKYRPLSEHSYAKP
jgi:hypothetical protein